MFIFKIEVFRWEGFGFWLNVENVKYFDLLLYFLIIFFLNIYINGYSM